MNRKYFLASIFILSFLLVIANPWDSPPVDSGSSIPSPQIPSGEVFDLTSNFQDVGWTEVSSSSDSNFILNEDGGINFDFSNGGFLSYVDSSGIQREFRDIRSAEDFESFIHFNNFGDVVSADFFVEDKGSNYRFKDTEIVAPGNSRVVFNSEDRMINLFLEDGTVIREGFVIFNEEDNEGVFISGSNIEFEEGIFLDEGVLGFDAEGFFIPAEDEATISGFQVVSENRVNLFESFIDDYFVFSDEGFSASGDFEIFNHNSYFPEADFSKGGFFSIGDVDENIPYYKRMLGVDDSDNLYNRELFNAVKKYQRENGLGVDGLLGQSTYNSLKENFRDFNQDVYFKLESSRVVYNSLDNTYVVENFAEGSAEMGYGGGNVLQVKEDNGRDLFFRRGVLNRVIDNFKVLSNEGMNFFENDFNSGINRFGSNEETIFNAFDQERIRREVFAKMRAKAGQCGVGAREIIKETLNLDKEEIGETFDGYWGFNAWDVKKKVSAGGGMTDISLDDVRPGDLVTFYSPQTRRDQHVGVVLGKDENGEILFAHQFGPKRDIHTAEYLVSNYNRYSSFSVHRPNYPTRIEKDFQVAMQGTYAQNGFVRG